MFVYQNDKLSDGPVTLLSYQSCGLKTTGAALCSAHGLSDPIFAKVGMGIYDNENRLGI